MGTYEKPVHDICVDKTSCRHELTAEGKPAKGPGPGVPPGGGQSQGAAAGEAVKASGQSRYKPPAGGSQQGS